MVTKFFDFGISRYFILFFQFLLSALPSGRFCFLFAPLATAGVSLQHFSALRRTTNFDFSLWQVCPFQNGYPTRHLAPFDTSQQRLSRFERAESFVESNRKPFHQSATFNGYTKLAS